MGISLKAKEKGGLEDRPKSDTLFLVSGDPDVLSLPALGSLDHVELDSLSFLKRTEAVGLNRRMMHKHIFAVGAADKSEALCVVKPFHYSLFHNHSLLLDVSQNSMWN